MEIKMDDIEQFQKHFVTPLVEAVRAEVQASVTPLVGDVKNLKARVEHLEGDQKKALIGYGVFSAGVAAIIGSAWGVIKSHLKLS